jgi:cyclopropane-fatty-acyl-phospholipid synthase
MPDFSGAKFDGDFSLSLEQAQRRKHDYVAKQIGIGPDVGCSIWGVAGARSSTSFAFAAGPGVGVTPSSAQLSECRQHGLPGA